MADFFQCLELDACEGKTCMIVQVVGGVGEEHVNTNMLVVGNPWNGLERVEQAADRRTRRVYTDDDALVVVLAIVVLHVPC